MIDGSITEFIDQLYYGQEIVFVYKGRKYFIQGWWNDDKTETTMELIEVETPSTGYIWEHHSDNMKECADAFLSAEIWEGKSFLQIQNEVAWADW